MTSLSAAWRFWVAWPDAILADRTSKMVFSLDNTWVPHVLSLTKFSTSLAFLHLNSVFMYTATYSVVSS